MYLAYGSCLQTRRVLQLFGSLFKRSNSVSLVTVGEGLEIPGEDLENGTATI